MKIYEFAFNSALLKTSSTCLHQPLRHYLLIIPAKFEGRLKVTYFHIARLQRYKTVTFGCLY